MTVTEAHKTVAEVGGEMSLAIVRREAPADVVAQWVRRLRLAADGLESRLQPRDGSPAVP